MRCNSYFQIYQFSVALLCISVLMCLLANIYLSLFIVHLCNVFYPTAKRGVLLFQQLLIAEGLRRSYNDSGFRSLIQLMMKAFRIPMC